MKRALYLALCLALLAAVFVVPRSAAAVERNFAGSAQLDYHFVPTQPGANAHESTFDGFTAEAAFKLAVDVSDRLSANLKVCFGCHGFEADMAYFDYRVADEANVRAGRFSPSFGAFNPRHDPANHRLSDKPLPYDMGRMLRFRDWNNGVLPSPFPDNGIELNGTHAFGTALQVDYAAYAVTGFKGDASAVDIDFQQSHSGSAYYTDNNGRPTVGGRTALSRRFSETFEATLGGSGMYGALDPDNKLTYLILGGDLTLRVDRTNIRFEYLVRRERFDVSDPTRFKYAVPTHGGDYFVKQGAYAEVEHPVTDTVDLLFRVDGMARSGNVLASSALASRSSVGRLTAGTAVTIERGLRLKASTELWRFSDADPRGHMVDVSFHLAAVVNY